MQRRPPLPNTSKLGWSLIALSTDLGAGLACAPAALRAGFAAAGVFALLAFRQQDVTRWRRPSVILFGAALAALGVAVVVTCGAAALGDVDRATITRCAIAAAVLPWPGHVLVWMFKRVTPRVAVRHRGTGEVVRALAADPTTRYVTPAGHEPALTAERRSAGGRAWLDVGPRVVALAPEPPSEGMSLVVKRTIDILFVLVAAPVAIIAVAILAVAVRLTSRGPAFHAQVRLTVGERRFRLWKLRSMVQDAEPGGIPVWPSDHDERITPLGRHLRRFWLDELPQLWSVLVGDMALVGPRPERPEFAEAFARDLPKYHRRHRVLAGLTGLAQVRGFLGDTSIRRRLAYDLEYGRSWSPCLDFWVLGQTVLRVFGRLTPGR